MKKLISLWVALCCIAFAPALHAQEGDAKYLAGAVPEVDGKVVFSKEFSIPQMPKQEIYQRLTTWLDARLKQNENNSRIVYTNEDNGQIVGTGDEWIVFSSSALSLDRTRILYQVSIECAAERCNIEISKIRYIYREGEEKYSAEEWIVDKYALNKSRTKLVRGLAKWRRKTVDFVDTFFMEAADALSANQTSAPATGGNVNASDKPADETETKSFANSGTTVITPKKTVTVADATPQPDAVRAEPAPVATPTPTPSPATQAYREVSPDQLMADAIQPNAGKLVIVIGSDPFNRVMMTANAGGSLGKVSGKPVVFTILSPEQSYEAVDKAETYTVCFYPNGSNEASLILECKEHPAPAAIEGMPRTYIGEIVKAMSK